MDVKVLVLAYLSINTTTQWKRIQSKIRYWSDSGTAIAEWIDGMNISEYNRYHKDVAFNLWWSRLQYLQDQFR
jgi:hypothetical protein